MWELVIVGTHMAIDAYASRKLNQLTYKGCQMGRMRENPRYNVISMRISDEERETLEEIMNTTKKSVSDIMREAMQLVKSRASIAELGKKAA
jgi:hypothetical protein